MTSLSRVKKYLRVLGTNLGPTDVRVALVAELLPQQDKVGMKTLKVEIMGGNKGHIHPIYNLTSGY